MSRRLRPLLCGLVSLGFAASVSDAQLVLPGAAPPAQQGSTGAPAKPKAASAPKGAGASQSGKAAAAPDVASLAGQPLLLNGKTGLLRISGDDKTVTIDKLQLPGEGVSDPSQRCVVDIVGDKPIQATNVGRPDGLERFEADVPACPFAFDVLSGAALVPSQITACVFKAADCQTSPGGLWGPDGSSVVGDAAKIVKERAEAERKMAKVLRAIEDRAKDSPEAASLVRDQNAFAGERDETCRAYLKESAHGYCALRLTEARAALLQTRLDELTRPGGAAKAESDKGEKTKSKKSAKEP